MTLVNLNGLFCQLIEEVDQAMKFFIEVEEKKSLSEITNYDEVMIIILIQNLTIFSLRF